MPNKTNKTNSNEDNSTELFDNFILITFADPHEPPVNVRIVFDSVDCKHAAAIVAEHISKDFEISNFFILVGRVLEKNLEISSENN